MAQGRNPGASSDRADELTWNLSHQAIQWLSLAEMTALRAATGINTAPEQVRQKIEAAIRPILRDAFAKIEAGLNSPEE